MKVRRKRRSTKDIEEAKIYFGTAYYYKMEREKRDLMFTNYIQSATNEYEDTIKAPAKQDK